MKMQRDAEIAKGMEERNIKYLENVLRPNPSTKKLWATKWGINKGKIRRVLKRRTGVGTTKKKIPTLSPELYCEWNNIKKKNIFNPVQLPDRKK